MQVKDCPILHCEYDYLIKPLVVEKLIKAFVTSKRDEMVTVLVLAVGIHPCKKLHTNATNLPCIIYHNYIHGTCHFMFMTLFNFTFIVDV